MIADMAPAVQNGRGTNIRIAAENYGSQTHRVRVERFIVYVHTVAETAPVAYCQQVNGADGAAAYMDMVANAST
jgi:hypothetical protein